MGVKNQERLFSSIQKGISISWQFADQLILLRWLASESGDIPYVLNPATSDLTSWILTPSGSFSQTESW